MALPAPRASQRRLSASPHGPAHALHTLIYPHTHTRKPTWTHHTLTRPCTRRQRPCRPLYYTHGTHVYTHSYTYASPAHVHLHTYTLHTLYTCYTVRTARMHTLHPAPPHTRTHACVHMHTSHVAALQPLSFFEPPGRRGEGAIGHLPGSWKTPSLLPPQLLGPACSRSEGAQRR